MSSYKNIEIPFVIILFLFVASPFIICFKGDIDFVVIIPIVYSYHLLQTS